MSILFLIIFVNFKKKAHAPWEIDRTMDFKSSKYLYTFYFHCISDLIQASLYRLAFLFSILSNKTLFHPDRDKFTTMKRRIEWRNKHFERPYSLQYTTSLCYCRIRRWRGREKGDIGKRTVGVGRRTAGDDTATTIAIDPIAIILLGRTMRTTPNRAPVGIGYCVLFYV